MRHQSKVRCERRGPSGAESCDDSPSSTSDSHSENIIHPPAPPRARDGANLTPGELATPVCAWSFWLHTRRERKMSVCDSQSVCCWQWGMCARRLFCTCPWETEGKISYPTHPQSLIRAPTFTIPPPPVLTRHKTAGKQDELWLKRVTFTFFTLPTHKLH